MTFKNSEKDRKSRIYIFLIILVLLLINGLLIWKLIQREKDNTQQEEQIDDLTEDKSRLEAMLSETELQLDDYKGRNAELDSIILEKNDIIAQKVGELRKALNSSNLNRSQIRRLEKEIRSLNEEIVGYRQQVDSLSKENRYLKDEVYAKEQEIKRKNENIDNLNETVTDQKETIAKGSVLKAVFIEGVAIRERRGKEKEVTRLGRADKIRVSFSIDNNPIAKAGKRTAYVQIITPNGNTLHDEGAGSGKLMFGGEATLYTAKQDFTFANKNESLEFNWPIGPAMTSGQYSVNIYCEGKLIGKSSFTLK